MPRYALLIATAARLATVVSLQLGASLATRTMPPRKKPDLRWANQIKHARAIYARSKSHRSHSGGFLGYINEKFGKEEGLFLEMVKAAFGDRLHEDALKDLVNNKFFQTDHLLASVCDDPENFFVMFRTLNNGFDFQTKSNFKKLYTGPAWHAAIHFVRKALIMHRRYNSAQ